MYRKIRFLLILSCLAVFVQANAQFDDPKTIEIGPHVGLSYYMGDINPYIPLAQSDLGFGGVVRYNWNNRWSFRFDYTHAKVKGSDEVIQWRPERGLSFTTNINDFSLVAEFNFLEYYTGNPKRNVSPYIFGGISVFQYTPYQRIVDAQLGLDTLVNLRNYKLDTIYRSTKPGSDELTFSSKLAEFFGGRGNKVSVSIPFGVGVKFALSRHMAATVEWRMQKAFTDYLDGIGGVYLDKGEPFEYTNIVYKKDAQGNILVVDGKKVVDVANSYALIYNLSDPTADVLKYNVDLNGNVVYPVDDQGNPIKDPAKGQFKANQQRGNSAFNDWFGMLRISLTWKFNLPDGRGCNLSKF